MTPTDPSPPIQKAQWKTVAIPSEHGGWSLTLEPVVLGLLVAWSFQSIVLGICALTAFMARTPLKTVLVDLWRKRWLIRSSFALKILLSEIALIFVLAILVINTTESQLIWIPLTLAFPLVLIELFFSMRSRSRRLIPELAGTIGISSVVALQVLSAGLSLSLAIGMWAVVSGRAIAALGYVRTQILKIHGRNAKNWHSDVAQIVALTVVLLTYVLAEVPTVSLILIGAIALFNAFAVRRTANKAKAIGLQQMTFGASVILATGLAV